jgi:NAD(P)H-dependent FMN reductase
VLAELLRRAHYSFVSDGVTFLEKVRGLKQMDMERPLYIPVILGTARKGRASEPVARFMLGEVRKREGVETELIDIRDLALPADDEGEAIKDARFSAQMSRADAIVIVVPEYNHGYPGLLKHALDTNLKEYIHKAVGLCGVSAGGFGGVRVVQSLLPVLRELGLVTIFWDMNFSAAHMLFDESGALRDQKFVGRADQFLKELVWMAKVLRHGRENVPLELNK